MTIENQNPLAKTCSICGINKPLSAFLQFDKQRGAIYGNVCSSCCKAGLNKKKVEDDSTRSHTEHGIDSKTKVQTDIEQRKQRETIEEEYYKEREKEELIADKKIEKVETISKEEKKHRESFLDKRPIIKKDANVKTENRYAKFAEEAKTAETKTVEINKTAENTKEAAKEEKRKTEHDFTVPFYDAAITGQIRYHGKDFLEFRLRLGKNASIVRNLEKGAQQNAPTPEPTKPGSRKR